MALEGPEALELQRDVALALIGPKYYSFQARPDDVDEWDEQTSFVDSQDRFAICLGGTGSGKTESAAFKTAKYVLETKPPRPRCPFWIVGDTYETVCDVCWVEKLSQHIPEERIHSFIWYQSKRQWPYSVSLRDPDNPDEVGWILEFKSYDQGLDQFKSKSIGGYWCNEEVPLVIVEEIQGRCRDYNSPGWADFTPIEVVSPEWPAIYDACMAGDEQSEHHRPGWRFYHLNTEKNTALAEGWAANFLKSVPSDMRDTRRIGTFSVLRGAVFKEWNEKLHVCEPFEIPHDWKRIRGVDFGHTNPFVCVWIAKEKTPDGDRYYVYDEHYEAGQLTKHHAEEIKEREWPPDDGIRHPSYGMTFSDHDPQQMAEFSQHGIQMTPALKAGNKSMSGRAISGINAGIETLRTLMGSRFPIEDGKPLFQVFSTCVNFKREVRSYRWPEGTDKKDPREVPIPKDDHSIDAVRYAIHSDMFKVTEPPKGVPTRHDWKPKHGVQLKTQRMAG